MATAKAARPIPARAEWDARSIELAEAQHLTGTARLLAENEMRDFYLVRKSGPVGEYMVRVEWWRTGQIRRISCGCPAGERGRACKHAGAVLHALYVRERAISQPDTDPLASWRRGFDW
jgi:hypothetical protein